MQEWILSDSCQYQTLSLYSSLPPVISEGFINSQSKGVYAEPWFRFLLPANTLEYPRHQHTERHYTFMLPFLSAPSKTRTSSFSHLGTVAEACSSEPWKRRGNWADVVSRKQSRAFPYGCMESLGKISLQESVKALMVCRCLLFDRVYNFVVIQCKNSPLRNKSNIFTPLVEFIKQART